MENICRVIGANIRSRRLSMGLSMAEIAKALGISYQQMQKYEKGKNKIACDKLVRVAARLGYTLNEICGLEPVVERADLSRLSRKLMLVKSAVLRERIMLLIDEIVEVHVDSVEIYCSGNGLEKKNP